MGAGLTAIDAMLSLRAHGFRGQVLLASRHGRLPQVHAAPQAMFAFRADEIAAQQSLRGMLRMVREAIAATNDWRVVIDALRPHTQALWQRLTTREQQRFLRLILPIWNLYRHRMAPEIAARVDAAMSEGSLRVMQSRGLTLTSNGPDVMMTEQGQAPQPLSRVVNATGLELSLARSSNPLLKQLLSTGMIEAHATGLGLATDPHGRAWGMVTRMCLRLARCAPANCSNPPPCPNCAFKPRMLLRAYWGNVLANPRCCQRA